MLSAITIFLNKPKAKICMPPRGQSAEKPSEMCLSDTPLQRTIYPLKTAVVQVVYSSCKTLRESFFYILLHQKCISCTNADLSMVCGHDERMKYEHLPKVRNNQARFTGHGFNPETV